ncbi:MAG: MmcQ/YjbR family DNA-binding protein [Actinomycetales bacterium]
MPEGADTDPMLAYCLAKPGAWRDEPWEGDVVAKVADKIFAFVAPASLGVKCAPGRDEADEWLAEYPEDATAMPYLARYGWNSLRRDGGIADDVLREAIDASYGQVVSKLPKSKRPG